MTVINEIFTKPIDRNSCAVFCAVYAVRAVVRIVAAARAMPLIRERLINFACEAENGGMHFAGGLLCRLF